MTYDATAVFLEKDENSQDQTSVYWFEIQSDDYRVESGEYGIAVCNGESTPLNEDGAPIDYNEIERAAVLALCEIPSEV